MSQNTTERSVVCWLHWLTGSSEPNEVRFSFFHLVDSLIGVTFAVVTKVQPNFGLLGHGKHVVDCAECGLIVRVFVIAAASVHLKYPFIQ